MVKKEGNIFFIPLFLPTDIKDNIKSYARYKFPETETYAFGRLIEIDQSGGDLVEIFKYIGNISASKEMIVKSGRLFDPIHVSMGFTKKRWQFIFEDESYDKIINSDYKNITFLLGIQEAPKLWQGGIVTEITSYDTNKYNQWEVYPPTKVENLLKTKLVHHQKQLKNGK